MAVANRHAAVPPDGRRPLGSPNGPATKRTARVLLCLYGQRLVVLHGFIKKTRATPDSDLATARTRQRGVGAMCKAHMGSSIDAFLEKEGIFEETQAHAIREVVAWQLAEAMKQQNIAKNKMARLLKTSRTQVDRLLDREKRHHARQLAACRRNGRPARERRVGVVGAGAGYLAPAGADGVGYRGASGAGDSGDSSPRNTRFGRGGAWGAGGHRPTSTSSPRPSGARAAPSSLRSPQPRPSWRRRDGGLQPSRIRRQRPHPSSGTRLPG